MPRTALVHDWLNQAGGAEVVLEELHDLFPDAPIYTAMFDRVGFRTAVGWDVRTSTLDRLPGIHRRHQWFLPLYPFAWQRTRVTGADVVVSNKSAFCMGVDTGKAAHVCYCLTPTRFVWEPTAYSAYESLPPGARLALAAILPWLRRWELRAAAKVDHFLAISTTVQERIRRRYGRDSEVVYPPVDTKRFAPGPDEDFYLILARLVPYKRIDLAIEAFERLGRRLVIAGDGRDRARLETLAGRHVEFAGRVSEQEARRLLGSCRALVWPGVEDFGLAPVEAMASGRPVIARRAGGALDTVVDRVTGVFFDDVDDRDALARAVTAADDVPWRSEALQRHARAFDSDVFRRRMLEIVGDAARARALSAVSSTRRPGGQRSLRTARRELVGSL